MPFTPTASLLFFLSDESWGKDNADGTLLEGFTVQLLEKSVLMVVAFTVSKVVSPDVKEGSR